MIHVSVQIVAAQKTSSSGSSDETLKELVESLKKMIESLPKTEVHFGTTPPLNPTEGDFWYHPDENRLYAYVVE